MKNKPELLPKTFRLQGTDGVRREIKLSKNSECKGYSPIKTFIEKSWITEEFMELYAYSFVKNYFRKKSHPPKKRTIIVGWDPRDPSKIFTEAVIKGVRKAGANTMVIGVVPTPLVPLFMLNKGVDGGIMVTASHNPKDQNGIKLFLPFHGMKPLPTDDIRLTQNLLRQNFSAIKKLPLKGNKTQCRLEAMELFRIFSLSKENSWIDSSDILKNLILVIDPAYGSLTGIAAQIFRDAGTGKVIEVNSVKNGSVNLRSGVAGLEGCIEITAKMILKPTGIFHSHKAITKLFELGRANQRSAKSGKKRISGAVFDADGDRFFRLDYDPFQDTLWVLSGDETAMLQAKHLVSRAPKKYKGSLYINTVESDLNASAAAKAIGLTPLLTAVGDKWILLKIRIASLEKELTRLPSAKIKKLQNKIIALKKEGVSSIDKLKELEAFLPVNTCNNNKEKNILAVGSEETGHNITAALTTLSNGKEAIIYSGNGLKSALNTFSATEHLAITLSPRKYIHSIRQPFSPGFKSTLYAYYVCQELFFKNSKIWRKVKKLLFRSAKQNGYSVRTRNFPDDPDMLYISLGRDQAGIFVRNSGTENKISVNLRGKKSDAAKLKRIGTETIKTLFSLLKDSDNPLYKMELHALSQMAIQPTTDKDLEIKNQYKIRLIDEMQKQKLIRPRTDGNTLTPLGKWYVKH